MTLAGSDQAIACLFILVVHAAALLWLTRPMERPLVAREPLFRTQLSLLRRSAAPIAPPKEVLPPRHRAAGRKVRARPVGTGSPDPGSAGQGPPASTGPLVAQGRLNLALVPGGAIAFASGTTKNMAPHVPGSLREQRATLAVSWRDSSLMGSFADAQKAGICADLKRALVGAQAGASASTLVDSLRRHGCKGW